MANPSFGQLTIKPATSNQDTYIYVKGQVLFVKEEINLQKNAGGSDFEASIYLREESQLLQGTSGPSKNTGNGLLSVFQEGTSNAYDYNYWASPIGKEAEGNGHFGINMLYAPVNRTKSDKAKNTLNLTGTATPLQISSRWIYTFSGINYEDWNYIGNKTEIPAGKGFSMKGVSGIDTTMVNSIKNNPGNSQRYDFRGKPNDGLIKIPVITGENVLVGNPYPSALDLSVFLLENSGSGTINSSCSDGQTRKNAITGIAYFWDAKENGDSHYLHRYEGGYGTFSPVDPCTAGIYEKPLFKTYKNGEETGNTGQTGKHYERRYTPVAQGFMVEGVSNSQVTFNNKQRIFKKEGQNSDFRQKEASQKKGLIVLPKLRLQVVINDEFTRSLSLAFWKKATAETDIAMDAKTFDLAPTDVGWLQNDESYVIDVRPFMENEEIPIYLQVDTLANFKFKIEDFENLELENIFLFDTLTKISHTLKDTLLQINLAPGIYHNRFRLTFKDKILEYSEPEIPPIDLFQNNSLGWLEVYNSSLLYINRVVLYDLSGRRVFEKKILGNSEVYKISTNKLSTSVYIAQVFYGNKVWFSKKITILEPN